MRQLSLAIFSLSMLAACGKTDAPETNIHAPADTSGAAAHQIKDGTYCFSKLLNQDVTTVDLTIAGNAVSGKMDWLPYEKDSARGTLQGFKNATGELDLTYDYMIEGSQQTETKIMKIEDGKLLVKVGELLDPKNDGNLVYKDVSQAKYSEVLEATSCK
jgi:major membrane immunogen (membrane-anchored lipoprotein)